MLILFLLVHSGPFPMSWAVGRGPSVFTSSHGSTTADRSKFSFDFGVSSSIILDNPPTPPSGVVISNLTSTSFTLSWTTSNSTLPINYYLVDVMQLPSGTYATVANVSLSSCSSTVCTVALSAGKVLSGVSYNVGVRAQSAAGFSDRSIVVAITTATATTGGSISYPVPAQITTSTTVSTVPNPGNVTAMALNWADLINLLGYPLQFYECQVTLKGSAYTTVYTGTATSFIYASNVDLSNSTNQFAARVRAQTNPGGLSAWIALTLRITAQTACLNDCSGRGLCIDGGCRCTGSFVGPDCSVGDAFSISLVPGPMKMMSKMVGNQVHFRLSAPITNWMSLAFDVGIDGMSASDGGPGDVIAASFENGAWTVVDANVQGQNYPVKDAVQSLLSPYAYVDGNMIYAAFSRVLDTGDSPADRKIKAGESIFQILAYFSC
jgi:hypothetical protein